VRPKELKGRICCKL